jgi:hypothetical protein
MPLSDKNPVSQTEYSTRTADDYLKQINADVRASLTTEQLTAVRAALEAAMPKANPKIVDLRINIDLIIARFYIVLFVGKDRRKNTRKLTPYGGNVIANRIVAIILLVGLNLTISLFIFLASYLIKSALGVDLFTHHLRDYVSK